MVQRGKTKTSKQSKIKKPRRVFLKELPLIMSNGKCICASELGFLDITDCILSAYLGTSKSYPFLNIAGFKIKLFMMKNSRQTLKRKEHNEPTIS